MPNKPPRYVVVTIAVIVLLVAAYFIYKALIFGIVSQDLPKEGDVIAFYEDGVSRRYTPEDNVLVRMAGEPRADGIAIYEQVDSPTNPAEKIVLAGVPDTDGLTAGVIQADGTFAPLVAGDTDKAGLIVTPDGLAIFGATPAVPSSLATGLYTQSEGETDESLEETGSTEIPVYLDESQVPATAASKLIAVDVTTGTITLFGQGRSPRLVEDGSIIALAPEGVVRINAKTGTRSVLLPAAGADANLSALSPSGKTAALVSGDGMRMDFFTINESFAPLGFLEMRPVLGTAFLDDRRILFHTAEDAAQVFKVPTEKLQIATPVAILPLTQ